MHGFVPALTSFVGREEDVAEAAALLSEYRLVTVTGPGGMGKTRLAGEVARQVAARFADGTWLVELAAVRDPGQVAASVAAALGVPNVLGCPPAETLAIVLGRQQALLVLATSREPIGLPGEARLRLRPLPVATPDSSPESGVPAAVQLFADRARQSDPRFVLDSGSEPMAARLAGRLDGLPLAIELAAARVEVLGLTQLLDRLEASLPLLVSADRTAAPRHQSLAATVDWSYRLLSEQEQRVFRRLAIFPGSFTLDAAATVAGAGAEPAVLHLVDCSLLSPPRPGPDGRVRYLMPEIIRLFGTDKLAEAALARHALAVAEQAAAGLRTREEMAAFHWLEAEDAALSSAAIWAREHDLGLALRLGVSLAEWWLTHGRGAQARELLLAAAERTEPGSHDWCLAQFWLGDIGPPAESLGRETAALEVLGAQAPSPLLAEMLAGRSRTLAYLGRLPEAAADAHAALAVARQIAYPPGEMLALAQLSRTAHFAGDPPGALEWARLAQRILAAPENGWTLQFTGNFVSEILIESGDMAAARRSIADGLAWAREAGDLLSQASGLALLADLDLRTGNIADSARHLRASIQVAIGIGWVGRLSRSLDQCAHLCAARGQWDEAVTLWSAYRANLDPDEAGDMPLHAQHRQEPLRRAAETLGPARSQAAQERGAGMTLSTSVEFALMLAGAELETQAAPAAKPDLAQLSAREQELVSLVAKGRTDAQIAGQLFISVSTVRSHLDRIRDKTSCRRRADLTRLALQTGLA
jgi:DNA-binding CsgD family transcriptional regulator